MIKQIKYNRIISELDSYLGKLVEDRLFYSGNVVFHDCNYNIIIDIVVGGDITNFYIDKIPLNLEGINTSTLKSMINKKTGYYFDYKLCMNSER